MTHRPVSDITKQSDEEETMLLCVEEASSHAAFTPYVGESYSDDLLCLDGDFNLAQLKAVTAYLEPGPPAPTTYEEMRLAIDSARAGSHFLPWITDSDLPDEIVIDGNHFNIAQLEAITAYLKHKNTRPAQ